MRRRLAVCFGFLFAFLPSSSAVQTAIPRTIVTVAGGGPPAGTSALNIAVGQSTSTAVDSQGNVYIAARTLSRVYKIGTNGLATLLVNETAGIDFPGGIAVDSSGNLYISDFGGSRILKLNTSGNLTAIAGVGGAGFSGDGGPATSAQLNFPNGLAVDTAGNVYIADSSNNRVRKVDVTGTITTVAGNGIGGFAGDNGPATSAELFFPNGVAVDSAGNLFIADGSNNLVRKVDTSGTITTVAPGAGFLFPSGVAVDGAGNLYVADTNTNRVVKVDATGTVTRVAGTGKQAFSGDNGPATTAALALPSGVTLDSAGNIYIADQLNSRIRKVDPSGIITTFAGNGFIGATGDGGPATSAELDDPFGVSLDSFGALFIADSSNGLVRKLSGGAITTVAGNGGPLSAVGDGGPATAAGFQFPSSTAQDRFGNLYIADTSNNRVRKVDTSGVITTVAGNGSAGFSGDNGPATSAQLKIPESIALDAAGNLYVSDRDNQRVRKVDTSGVITTVAGNGTAGAAGDNGPAVNAQLNSPFGIALDSAGNLYIADLFNSAIRKVDTSGTITTVAGGISGFAGDGGPATSAALNEPVAVAVDEAGNLYISDGVNARIRMVNASGIITTIAGTGVFGFSGDNGPATSAQVSFPFGMAADHAGNLFIADSNNNRVREIISGIGISTFNLDFGQVAAGFSSPLQFQVSNTGTTPLNISALSVSGANAGAFSPSNNCIGAVPVGGQCAITVNFKPGGKTPHTATLSIADDALSGVQFVHLTGTGVSPFSMSPAGAGILIPVPGGSASTQFSIAPATGFTGAVNLACAVTFAGQGTAVDLPTCTLSPAQFTFPATGPANATVIIATTGPSAALVQPAGPGGPGWLGLASLALLGLVLAGTGRSSKLRALSPLALCAAIFVLAGAGCGGGGSHRIPDPGTTPGPYTVVVAAASGNVTVASIVNVIVQ